MTAVAVLSGAAVAAGAFLLPMLAGAPRPDHALRRAQVRRRDLPGCTASDRRAASLLEAASARARASYEQQRPAQPGAALSPRFALAGGSAAVTSTAVGRGCAAAAQALACAPLRPDYAARYKASLAEEVRRRGLELHGCWAVVTPPEATTDPAVAAVVTTWLEVGLPGATRRIDLSATEVILVGGDICATITVLGLDVLSQGGALRSMVSAVSRRLPDTTASRSTAAATDWMFWPHGD